MACLPLVRGYLATACTSLTRKSIRTFPLVSACHTNHNLCSATMRHVMAALKKRTCEFLAPSHMLCEHYHAGVKRQILENVPQLDLDCEDVDNTPLVKEETVNASEILQNLSPEDTKKLKMIKLEFDVHGELSGKVPETMTDENWLHALQLSSKSKRSGYYAFLRKKENIQKSKQQKKASRQQQQQLDTVTQEDRGARFAKNTIFMMVRETTMTQVANSRLARAMVFGQPLVFDLNYEQYMRPQDCQNLVDQLIDTYAKNRSHLNPFHMVFTSVNPSGMILPRLKRQFLSGQHFLGTMTDRSYLELFPREKLVYLSPHAQHELKQVSDDDVYIVGGFIDKACNKPVSLARAKEQGIRTAKLPLDTYLLWGDGSKSLTLDQVLGILLEQRESNDWVKALQVVPRRKLKRNDV